MIFKQQIDSNRRHLAGVRVEVQEGREDRFVIDKENGASDVVDDRPLDGFLQRRKLRVKGRPSRAPTAVVGPLACVIGSEGVGCAGGTGPVSTIREDCRNYAVTLCVTIA